MNKTNRGVLKKVEGVQVKERGNKGCTWVESLGKKKRDWEGKKSDLL